MPKKLKIGQWSLFYAGCQQCGTTTKKHKGRGLCTACTDSRAKKEKRKRQLIKNSKNYYIKHNKKNLKNITIEFKKKFRAILRNIKKIKKKASKKYYKKNKQALILLGKIYRRRKKGDFRVWKFTLTEKKRFLPFETLEKPPTYGGINSEAYAEWKKNIKIFEILKKFRNKK